MSEYEWLDIFAGNLLSIMEEVGINQSQLARESGLTQGAISKYLNRQRMPSVKAIINIAYALDCDILELIDFGDTID